MATSGSVDFSVTRNDIITGAMRAIRAIGEGETPTSYEISNGSQALNMLVKQWQGATNFAPGLKVWARKVGYVFLQTNTIQYLLGPSGDNWTNSYVSTTTTAASNSGDSTITVASASGLAASQYIGIELVTGALQWTTISGSPTTTVTLAASLTANVASGARVFAYTAKAQRPLSIITATLRDDATRDTPLEIMRTWQEYEALPNKTQDGTPCSLLYESSLTNGTLLLDVAPTDVSYVIRLTYHRPIEDFDSTADEPDYPQEWFRALKYGLARELAPELKREWTKELQALYSESLMIAQQSDPEVSDSYFQPGRD